jgi:hypothetical protein
VQGMAWAWSRCVSYAELCTPSWRRTIVA